MREWLSLRWMPWHLPWVAGFAIVMAVIGPFGTYVTMSLAVRLLYFALVGAAFWGSILAAVRLSGRWEATARWPLPLRLAVAGVVAAVPGTAAVFLVQAWLVRPIPLRFAVEVFAESAFLAAALSVVVGLFADWRLHAEADRERARVAEAAVAAALPPAESAAPAPAAAPDFFRRIPPALGRDLLALEMEDHYLRIHTAAGSDLILLRLRDALAELGAGRGLQVHRSWWVAEGAVASVERGSGKSVLLLRNGLRVPVSKTYREPVKQAGWLDRAA